MSYDLIAIFPRDADFDREAWNRALADAGLDVQLHEEFEVEELNGILRFTAKGIVVAPEVCFRRHHRRGRSCISMSCNGQVEIDAAFMALAGLLSLVDGKLELPPKQDEDPVITAAEALTRAKALMIDKSKLNRRTKSLPLTETEMFSEIAPSILDHARFTERRVFQTTWRRHIFSNPIFIRHLPTMTQSLTFLQDSTHVGSFEWNLAITFRTGEFSQIVKLQATPGHPYPAHAFVDGKASGAGGPFDLTEDGRKTLRTTLQKKILPFVDTLATFEGIVWLYEAKKNKQIFNGSWSANDFYHGFILEQVGRTDEALISYKKALELKPQLNDTEAELEIIAAAERSAKRLTNLAN